MNYRDAVLRLQQLLAPLAVDEFLDRTLTGGPRKLAGEATPARTALLGADPQALLAGAAQLAPQIVVAGGDPVVGARLASLDATGFAERIGELRARGGSLRFPGVRALSPPLDVLARALEMLLHQPVETYACWSGAGLRTAVAADTHDALIVQLQGTTRWQVSTRPSDLANSWHTLLDRPAELGAHETLELAPAELLYLPRGTAYSVASAEESLYLTLGFTPLTVRTAVIAALDHLSDIDRGWRMTFGGPLPLLVRGPGVERYLPTTSEAAANLATACKAPGFLASALQARSARVVAALPPLPVPNPLPVIAADTELAQGETAFCHLIGSPEQIDISYPGGHLYIPRSAQPAIEYIVNTPQFRVRDIPAENDETRVSLAARFVAIGFLKPTPGGGA
ncbi:MAG: hypothetical protein JO173_12800 [Gammaproteobacteria bacterium]|nr:hypothetical protein [Gammaproteobacteria bacterium]